MRNFVLGLIAGAAVFVGSVALAEETGITDMLDDHETRIASLEGWVFDHGPGGGTEWGIWPLWAVTETTGENAVFIYALEQRWACFDEAAALATGDGDVLWQAMVVCGLPEEDRADWWATQ